MWYLRCCTILCHITILSKIRCFLASCLITNWLVFMLLLLLSQPWCRSFVRSFLLITKLSLLVRAIPIRLAHSSISSCLSNELFFSTWAFWCPFAFLSVFFLVFSFAWWIFRLSSAVPNLEVEDRAICPRVLSSKDDFRFFRDIRFSSNPRPVLSLSLSLSLLFSPQFIWAEFINKL